MRLRGLWLAGLLILLVGSCAVANVAPSMEDQYIATPQDEAVTFEFRAEDADIDPDDPAAHPLVFSILEGPEHGVLVGDLDDVRYRAFHTAAVEMTYIPAEGYVGTDYITIEVRDPFDATAAGITTIEIDVQERRAIGILSGNWIGEVTYNTQTGGFTAFRTQFTEVYRIGDLTVKGVADISMETNAGVKEMVFQSLRFDTDFSIIGIDTTSTIAFDPTASVAAELFDYWLTVTRFSLGEVDFTHTLYLLDTQTDSYTSLAVQANIGSVSISGNTRFDLAPTCNFLFSGATARIGWSYCDLMMLATMEASCNGFESITLGAYDIPIPGFGWFWGDVFVDAALTFDLAEGKTLNVTADWQPGTFACIELLGELNLAGPGGGAISGATIYESTWIYGLRLECSIPSAYGDISFVSATSFDPIKNSTVTGQTDYFEVFRFTGPMLACCGYPGTWSMATYFNTTSTQLFDWGMTILSMDVGLSNHFTFMFETAFRSGHFGDPKLEITVGWTVRW